MSAVLLKAQKENTKKSAQIPILPIQKIYPALFLERSRTHPLFLIKTSKKRKSKPNAVVVFVVERKKLADSRRQPARPQEIRQLAISFDVLGQRQILMLVVRQVICRFGALHGVVNGGECYQNQQIITCMLRIP